jgi:hypothetical protein
LRTLLLAGIPAFITAIALSLFVHQFAHAVVVRTVCGQEVLSIRTVMNIEETQTGCPLASVAGPVATFAIALGSFALFMRSPRNLFFASMAFVNASVRLPESLSAFFHLLFYQKPRLAVDESAIVDLLHFSDPTIPTVILCFFSLTLISLTITVIHETKMVPWKWLVALGMFAAMFPLEKLLWAVIAPLAS